MDRRNYSVSEQSLNQGLQKFWPATSEQADDVVCWQPLLDNFKLFCEQSASASLAEEAGLLDTFFSFSDGNSEDRRQQVAEFCNEASLDEVLFVARQDDETGADQAVNKSHCIIFKETNCPAFLVDVPLKPGVTLMSQLKELKRETPGGLSLGQALVQIAQDPALNPFLNGVYKLLMAYLDDEFFPLESSQQMQEVLFQPFARLAFNQYQKKRDTLISKKLEVSFLKELSDYFKKWYQLHKDFFVVMWELDRWAQDINMQQSERQLVRDSFNKGRNWLLSHYADQSFDDIDYEIEPDYPFPPLTRQQFRFNCYVAQELDSILVLLHPFFKKLDFDELSTDESLKGLLKILKAVQQEFKPAIKKVTDLENYISRHACKSSLLDKSFVLEIKRYFQHVDDLVLVIQDTCNIDSICIDFIKKIKYAKNDKAGDKQKGLVATEFCQRAEENNLFQLKEEIEKIRNTLGNNSESFNEMIEVVEQFRTQHLRGSILVLNAKFKGTFVPDFFHERMSRLTKKLSCFTEVDESKNKSKQPDLLELGSDITSLFTVLRTYRDNVDELKKSNEDTAKCVEKIIDGCKEALNKANDLLFLGCHPSCSAMLSVVNEFSERLKEFFANVDKDTKGAIEKFVSEGNKIIAQARQNEALIVHRHLFMEGVRQCCRFFGAEGPRTDRIVKVGKLADSMKDLMLLIGQEISDTNDNNSVAKRGLSSRLGG